MKGEIMSEMNLLKSAVECLEQAARDMDCAIEPMRQAHTPQDESDVPRQALCSHAEEIRGYRERIDAMAVLLNRSRSLLQL